jgi:hypothetical protein
MAWGADEAGGARAFVNGHTHAFNVITPYRMLAHVLDDLAHAHQQLRVIKNRLTDRNAIPAELSSFPEQPGCLSQYSHGNWSVIRRHATKLAASHKNRSGAQLCCPERSGHTGRSSPNDYDIHKTLPLDAATVSFRTGAVNPMCHDFRSYS